MKFICSNRPHWKRHKMSPMLRRIRRRLRTVLAPCFAPGSVVTRGTRNRSSGRFGVEAPQVAEGGVSLVFEHVHRCTPARDTERSFATPTDPQILRLEVLPAANAPACLPCDWTYRRQTLLWRTEVESQEWSAGLESLRLTIVLVGKESWFRRLIHGTEALPPQEGLLVGIALPFFFDSPEPPFALPGLPLPPPVLSRSVLRPCSSPGRLSELERELSPGVAPGGATGVEGMNVTTSSAGENLALLRGNGVGARSRVLRNSVDMGGAAPAPAAPVALFLDSRAASLFTFTLCKNV